MVVAAALLRAREAGQSKICNLGTVVVVEQHVERLEVAVYEVLPMEEGHPLGNVCGDLQPQNAGERDRQVAQDLA